MTWAVLQTDKGKWVTWAPSITDVFERESGHCDVHTLMFPDGVTVRHDVSILLELLEVLYEQHYDENDSGHGEEPVPDCGDDHDSDCDAD